MKQPASKKRQRLRFHKMHSLGNDFVVVDGITQSLNLNADLIAAWGTRHTGIGFDQLLTIEPPTETDADFWYRVYNADGSTAEQCGNGTRAVTLLARHLQLTRKTTLHWQSPGGRLTTSFNNPQNIETIMTPPVLEAADIPFQSAQAIQAENDPQHAINSYLLSASDKNFCVTPVSMGNPHAVMFVDNIFDTDVEAIGRQLTKHPAYPSGTNVEFCQIVDRQFMRLRVFERGVGETQACGSGACAAAVVARLKNLIDPRVKVSLPGGKLRISWSDHNTPLTMTGSATLVFSGELTL